MPTRLIIGGKTNCLEVLLQYNGTESIETYTTPIQVTSTIYYESGKVVEANDQKILVIQNPLPILSATSRQAR